MGYDSENALIGLGTVGLTILAYIISLIFLGFLKMYVCFTKKGVTLYNYLHKKLIFSIAIKISLETYIEMLIYGYI